MDMAEEKYAERNVTTEVPPCQEEFPPLVIKTGPDDLFVPISAAEEISPGSQTVFLFFIFFLFGDYLFIYFYVHLFICFFVSLFFCFFVFLFVVIF